MGLLHAEVDFQFALLGWLLLLPAIGIAVRALKGRLIDDPHTQHAWLAGAVGVALLWSMTVGAGDGVRFGMLGAALYGLMFGRARGCLGLLLALTVHTLLGEGSWLGFGLNGLLFAGVPVMVAVTLQRLIEARLPHNVFVFIIGNGLFVTLATTVVTSLLLLLCSLALLTPLAVDQIDDYVAYTLLMAWGEALISGMIFSSLVLFLPATVLTYRQDTYLPRRGRR